MKITTISPISELKKLRNIALNPNASLRYAFMRGKQLQSAEIDQFSDTILSFSNQTSKLQEHIPKYNGICEFLWFSIRHQKNGCAGVQNKKELHKLFDEYLTTHNYFIFEESSIDEKTGKMIPSDLSLQESTEIKNIFYCNCKALRELSLSLNGEKHKQESPRYLSMRRSRKIHEKFYDFNFEQVDQNNYTPSEKAMFLERRRQLENMIGFLGKDFYNYPLKDQVNILNQFAEQLCFDNAQEYLIDGINKLKNIYGTYFGQLALQKRSFLYSLLTKDNFYTVLSEQGQIGFFPQFVLSLITMEFNMLFQSIEPEKMIAQISKEQSKNLHTPTSVLEYRLSQLKEACEIGNVSYESFSSDFQQSKVIFTKKNAEDCVTMTIEEILSYLDVFEKMLEAKQQKEKVIKK